jgi:nitroreductase
MKTAIETVISRRHSTRSFLTKPLKKSTIKKLLDAARWAPSACNLQLTEYVVITDKRLLSLLAEKCTPKFHWAPTYIVLVYDSRLGNNRNTNLVSLGAAMENLLLSAESRKIATCPIAGFSNDAFLKRLLHLPLHYRIGIVIAVGYASNNFTKDRLRLPLNKLYHHNSWASKGNLKVISNRLEEWGEDEIVNYRQRLAPVYLYVNHYSLHQYPEIVYQKSLEILASKLSTKQSLKVLDLMSYDGIFARLLAKNTAWQITLSDCLTYCLKVLKRSLPEINTTVIKKGQVCTKGVFDLITAVQKLQFTPNFEVLLKNAMTRLVNGGYLFIVVDADFIPTALISKLKINLFSRNCYDNNPFYKIGPYKQVPATKLLKIAKTLSLNVVDKGYTTTTSSRFFWILLSYESIARSQNSSDTIPIK